MVAMARAEFFPRIPAFFHLPHREGFESTEKRARSSPRNALTPPWFAC